MEQSNDKLNRSLGLWSALSLVIGTIVGAGVFIRQSAVLQETKTPILALLAWLIGGIITIMAGLSISEIASQMPYTGGLYVYMNSIYGEILGFLAGWMQVIVYGPAMIASLGAYLGILLVKLFEISTVWQVPIGVTSIVLITILNFFSNKYGARFAIITTICKLIPIILIVWLGFHSGRTASVTYEISRDNIPQGNFGIAILATLFAFDGWILVANLGDEIQNAKKKLPQAIIVGILSVIMMYLLVAWSVFELITPSQISKLGVGVIPYIIIQKFGKLGGKLLSLGIIISIIGCMNGKIMAFPRIMFAMSQKHELPYSKLLASTHSKTKTPILAILVVSFISSLMVIFTNADRLSELCIFTVYCFYVLTFLGMFKLRRHNKKRSIGFRVPFFPLPPIIAIVGSFYVIISEILNDPMGVLFSFLLVIIGIPIFLISKRYYTQLDYFFVGRKK